MRDMNGTALREGHHIVIPWNGGDLMQATVLEILPQRHYGLETATLVLQLSDGRKYRRRHIYRQQLLILR